MNADDGISLVAALIAGAALTLSFFSFRHTSRYSKEIVRRELHTRLLSVRKQSIELRSSLNLWLYEFRDRLVALARPQAEQEAANNDHHSRATEIDKITKIAEDHMAELETDTSNDFMVMIGHISKLEKLLSMALADFHELKHIKNVAKLR